MYTYVYTLYRLVYSSLGFMLDIAILSGCYFGFINQQTSPGARTTGFPWL